MFCPIYAQTVWNASSRHMVTVGLGISVQCHLDSSRHWLQLVWELVFSAILTVVDTCYSWFGH